LTTHVRPLILERGTLGHALLFSVFRSQTISSDSFAAERSRRLDCRLVKQEARIQWLKNLIGAPLSKSVR
jgi:hypothetical protein